jgi:hypothetical protein
MNSFKEHISSNEILAFLVITLLSGYGLTEISAVIEMSTQLLFMDVAIATLILATGVKFVTEKL